jgi:hypothetical protein
VAGVDGSSLPEECGYEFRSGGEYLVYAYSSGGVLKANACDTLQVKDAEEIERELGEFEQTGSQWLRERYDEASSIRVGMTRAELIKVFSEDGGLQSIPASRYVLKSSTMIKVDVKFEFPEGIDHRTATDDQLHIKSISKPYLEPMYLD